MKLNNLKRIAKEEFPNDSQNIIEKLAFLLNPYLEQVNNAFNKNIDFDNLNQELLTIEVTLNANGVPLVQTEIKSNLKTKINGLQVIRALNLTNDGTFPTGAPFITFDLNGSTISIKHVTGIPANKKYQLTVISIG